MFYTNLFLIFVAQWTTSSTVSACTKFTDEPNLIATGMVEGRCMYGFSVGYQYNPARTLCESEGTQLVTLQSETKQEAVWTTLGSNFGQHWMGLEKTNDIWQWNENGVLIDVTSTRWENVQSSNNVAYTMSSQDRYLWKMTNTDSWYKPVCEEISDTSSNAFLVSDTETSTVASPTTTTTLPDTSSNAISVTDTETSTVTSSTSTTTPGTKKMSILFVRHLQALKNVVVYKTVTAVSANHCAVRCLMFSQCRYFRLVVADGPNCDLMEVNSATFANYDCSVHKCYKRSLV